MSPDDNGGSTAYHPPVAAPAHAPPNRHQRRAMQKMARSAAKRAKREARDAEAAARVAAAHAAEPPVHETHIMTGRDMKPDNVPLETPAQPGVERFLDDNGPRAPAADVLEAALTSVVKSRPTPPITTNAPGNGSEQPVSLAEKIRAAKRTT